LETYLSVWLWLTPVVLLVLHYVGSKINSYKDESAFDEGAVELSWRNQVPFRIGVVALSDDSLFVCKAGALMVRKNTWGISVADLTL
jgi:hypothetical protein